MLLPTRKLLCLYGAYADSTESKLSLLVGGRSYRHFRSQAMPFVFRLLDETLAPKNEEIDALFFQYMVALQLDYRQALIATRAAEVSQFEEFAGEERKVGPRDLLRNHSVLSAADGSEVDIFMEQLLPRLDTPLNASTQTLEDLRTCLEEARIAYIQLERFYADCARREIQVYYNPNQGVTEFKNFLTHISRSLVFHCLGEDELCRHELDAGIVHLKRVTLDTQKSIITTAFLRRKSPIPRTAVLAALKARHDEIRIPTRSNHKLRVYKELSAEFSKFGWA